MNYNRKQLKQRAKTTVKRHYVLLVALCLIAVVLGSEFQTTTAGWTTNTETVSEETRELQGSQGISEESTVAQSVYDLLLAGDYENAKQLAQDTKEAYESRLDTTDVRMGRTEGVLASFVNTVSSGSLWITFVTLVLRITSSQSFAIFLVVFLAGTLSVLFTIFIVSYYRIVMRRMFLEAGTYEKVPLSHAFYSFVTKKNFKAALAYFKTKFYLFLWWLTVIGGIIKSYSYAMVPCILAENPNLKGNEAIRLSRTMMNGHKFEYFKLQVSMLGWHLLNLFTLGFLNIFWVNPYVTSVECQYYAWLRSVAKEQQLPGSEKLNDQYLFEKAEDEVLQIAYSDIAEQESYIQEHDFVLTGIKKFFAENLGIWLGSIADKKRYQTLENMKYHIEGEQDAIAKNAYPNRLSPLYMPKTKKRFFSVPFIRCYTVWNLILLYMLFSLIGWIWEVLRTVVRLGLLVNRGMLQEPYIAVYGTGGVLALVLLTRLKKNPPVCIAASMLVSAVAEYFTAWYCETMFHARWWDYTGYFLNLDGRVCAEGLLLFGMACALVIYLLAPLLDELFSKIPTKVIVPLSLILLILFGIDFSYSSVHPNMGEGISTMVRE